MKHSSCASIRYTIKKMATAVAGLTLLLGIQNCGKGMQSAGTGDSSASLVNAPPPSPTNLNAAVVTSTDVVLTWVDPSSGENAAASYTIERAAVSGSTVGMYVVVASVAAGATTFSDTTVTANTTYNYVVLSANADGASVPTSVVTITTTP